MNTDSRFHVTIDVLGNPVEIVLAGGQAADISVTPELFKAHNNRNIIAYKGYDSDALVKTIKNKSTAVIPPRSNRKTQRDYDRRLYKERHLVENFFSKIKEYRKIAARYDKLADVSLSFVYFAAALIYLR